MRLASDNSLYRAAVISIVMWCVLLSSIAAQPSYIVRHFTVNEGLTDHRVWCIHQHSNGFIYLGTEKGLCRFDGYGGSEVPVINRPQGPYNYVVGQIHEQDDGQLIVSHGPTRFEQEAYDVIDLESLRATSLSPVNARDSSTWYRINGTLFPLSPQEKLPPPENVKEDDHGNFFKVYADRRDNIYSARLILSSGDSVDFSDTWSSIYYWNDIYGVDFTNIIYVPTLNGLITIEVDRTPFTSYLNAAIQDWEYKLSCRAMVRLGQDTLIVSTEREGLAIIDLRTGITSFPSFHDVSSGQPVELNNIRGMTLESDRGLLWATPFDGPLCRIDISAGVVEQFSADTLHTLTSIALGDSAIIAARGRWNKGYRLELFDLRTERRREITLDTLKSVNADLRSTFLLESASGMLWYGTVAGLFKIDITQQKILAAYFGPEVTPSPSGFPFPVFHTLSASNILAMYESADGTLWIGLEEGGVNVLDPVTGSVQTLTKKDGLPHNTVCGILPDAYGFWFSTYNGLSHYDTARQYFRNFYRENGLSHDEFNRFSFCRDDQGRYFFGTMNGVTSFVPEEVLGENENVDILLCEAGYFERGGKNNVVQRTGFTEPYRFYIPSQNRSCHFEFSLADYRNAHGHTYAYALEKASDQIEHGDWRFNGTNRTVRFEYLPAGTYVLRVRGITSSGVPSGEIAIDLHVREYFYKTWWFIALCIAGGFGLLAVVHRYRLNQLLAMERLRTRLSSDLHDDVGGLLSGVALQMELLSRTVAPAHKALVKRIADSSRTAMIRMRDVIWAIDSRHSSFQDLFERMNEYANEVLPPLGIAYQLATPQVNPAKDVPPDIRHALILIFKEFITNTVKHANASMITVEICRDVRSYHFDMHDNGQGIEDDRVISTGQGLENMRMRVEKLGGTLTFNNENGFGFRAVLPEF